MKHGLEVLNLLPRKGLIFAISKISAAQKLNDSAFQSCSPVISHMQS